MVKTWKSVCVIMVNVLVACSLISCDGSNKNNNGNKLNVDNIYKGSGKFDKDTYYIGALNVDMVSNNSFMKYDALNVGINSLEEKTINPYFIESKSDIYIIQSLWEPLMKKGYDGEFYPNILKKLPTVSEDKTIYLFSLREDLTWEDGSKITTKDIEFTYKFLMDKFYDGSFNREMLNVKNWIEYKDGVKDSIDGIEILDDFNFKVIVETPNINTMELLNIYPLSYLYYSQYYSQGGSIQKETNVKPFGNGVFKFLGFEDNKYIILESNPYYYKGKSDIKTLTYKKIDEKDWINEIVSGNIDILRDVFLNEDNIVETSKAQFLSGYIFPNWEYLYIGINHTNPILKDVNVRKAIDLCIDKNLIIEKLSNKNLNILNIPLDKNFFNLYDSEIDSINNFDKHAAIKLLEKSGWKKTSNGIREKDNQKLELVFLTKKNDYILSEIIPIIEKNLSNVGIGLIIQEASDNLIKTTHNDQEENNPILYDLFLMNPNFNFNPDWIMSFSTLGANNWYGYSNENLDKILNDIFYEFDVDKSTELYNEAKKIIKEDIPVIPIFQNKQIDIYNGRILGINSANIYKTFYYDEIILKK